MTDNKLFRESLQFSRIAAEGFQFVGHGIAFLSSMLWQ
jgi:hypothetical protein